MMITGVWNAPDRALLTGIAIARVRPSDITAKSTSRRRTNILFTSRAATRILIKMKLLTARGKMLPVMRFLVASD